MPVPDRWRRIACCCLVALLATLVPGDGAAATALRVAGGDEPVPPRLGIFFDSEATVTFGIITAREATFTAHVFLVGATHPAGGARFALWLDPRLQLMDATYPPATVVGEPLTGLAIDFTGCEAIGAPVLVATLTVGTGPSFIDNEEMRVDPWPSTGAVEYLDCDGVAYGVPGGSAFVTRVTPVTSATWGAVRNLYRR